MSFQIFAKRMSNQRRHFHYQKFFIPFSLVLIFFPSRLGTMLGTMRVDVHWRQNGNSFVKWKRSKCHQNEFGVSKNRLGKFFLIFILIFFIVSGLFSLVDKLVIGPRNNFGFSDDLRFLSISRWSYHSQINQERMLFMLFFCCYFRLIYKNEIKFCDAWKMSERTKTQREETVDHFIICNESSGKSASALVSIRLLSTYESFCEDKKSTFEREAKKHDQNMDNKEWNVNTKRKRERANNPK